MGDVYLKQGIWKAGNAMGKLILLFAVVALLTGIPYLLLIWYERRQKNAWRLVAEGAYERSEVRSSVMAARRLANDGHNDHIFPRRKDLAHTGRYLQSACSGNQDKGL